MPETSTADRRTSITDATIRVLALHGGRGLTHRAVDRELALADGSTANYFPTRTALLAACAERLAELGLADIEALPKLPATGLKRSQLAQRIAANLLHRLKGDRRLRELARLELLLEANRSESMQAQFAELRRLFIKAVADGLAAAEVPGAYETAQGVVAVYDGLLFDQLLYSRTALDRDLIVNRLSAVIEPSRDVGSHPG